MEIEEYNASVTSNAEFEKDAEFWRIAIFATCSQCGTQNINQAVNYLPRYEKLTK